MEESRLVEFINYLPDDSWEFSPDEAYRMWKEREGTVWQTREILVEKARNRKGRFQEPDFDICYYPAHITNVQVDEHLAETPWELCLTFHSEMEWESYRLDINHVLNRVLNILFELPMDEISILNLSPLYLEQSSGTFQFYIVNYENDDENYQFSPEFEVCQLDYKLIFGVPHSHQQRYNLITIEVESDWLDRLDPKPDNNHHVIPLFDFILVQRSKSEPIDKSTATCSLYFSVKDDYSKKRSSEIVPLDIANSLKLGSYRSFTIELCPFYNRNRIECKLDFVNYCQSVIQHLENPEIQPRPFTIWPDFISSRLYNFGFNSYPSSTNICQSNCNAWILALAPG